MRTRSSTGHPVITGLLILVALGMIIQLLPYLLAAAAITGLIWGIRKLHHSSQHKAAARIERDAANAHRRRQAELHEQQQTQSFLLAEDKEWLRQWT